MTNDEKSKLRVRIISGILIFLGVFSTALVVMVEYKVDISPLGVLTTSLFSFAGATVLGNWVTPAGGFKNEDSK